MVREILTFAVLSMSSLVTEKYPAKHFQPVREFLSIYIKVLK